MRDQQSDRLFSEFVQRMDEADPELQNRHATQEQRGTSRLAIISQRIRDLFSFPDNQDAVGDVDVNDLGRREALKKIMTLGAGAYFGRGIPFPLRIIKDTETVGDKEKSPEKNSFLPAYLLSPANVDALSVLDTDIDLGSNPKREKEKESKYFIPEPGNLRTLAKLLTNKEIAHGLHPLGPYGKLLFELVYLSPQTAFSVFTEMKKTGTYQQLLPCTEAEFAEKSFAEIIGLPMEVLFSLMMAKSLNESLWNHLAKMEQGKKFVMGVGLFQQELSKALSTFPDWLDLQTAKQQIIYELGKIAAAAIAVKKKGGSFTFKDLEFYYLGDSHGKEESKYGKAWQVALVNFKRIIRNMAAGDPTGQDLLKLFSLWQKGDKEYNIWPEAGNAGDQIASFKNFELIFKTFLKDGESLFFKRYRAQKAPEKIGLTDKTQYVALYLRAIYGGQSLPLAISKKDLLGFSEENFYFALAYLGFAVLPYDEYSKLNKVIKKRETYNLVDFLDNGADYQKIIPKLFTLPVSKPERSSDTQPAKSRKGSDEMPSKPFTEKSSAEQPEKS